MKILGVSAFYHDSAAALVVDGEIIAAAQEERFTRVKQDERFPVHAISACLKLGGISLGELDAVVFYEKPFLHFDRLLETYLAFAPRGFRSFRRSMPLWLSDKLFLKRKLMTELHAINRSFSEDRLLFSEHHVSHAASAFFPSPFREAAILTMDGVGEWTTTSISVGNDRTIERLKEMCFPHSLGLLYSAFTMYAGFKVNSGEYKLMGLAPYGEPRFAQRIFENLVDLKDDGSFRLNLDYFDYCTGLRMINAKFESLFGAPARPPESLITQHTMDISASIQAVLELIILRTTRTIANETQLRHLCLAGGMALNCVANGKILRDGHFDSLWIQPASGDAGGALGAALAVSHMHFAEKRSSPSQTGDAMKGAYLGPHYTSDDSNRELKAAGARFETLSEEEIIERTARALASGHAVGWHQGRMEFGPRALGNRSILADPRSPQTQKLLNLKIKFRESFRPFAPAVIKEKVSDWFEFHGASPYMLLVADVKKSRRIETSPPESSLFGIERLNLPRSQIPAVTHVDYSARLQTVDRETNPKFYRLLERFEALSGCPILVNTSFNVRSEPIVESPTDAFRCFMGTDLDVLVVGCHYLEKPNQDPLLKARYHQNFQLD